MSPLATSIAPPVSWPPITDCPIPMLDLTAFLQEVPGALEALGAALRHTLEQVGFYYICGHSIPQDLIDEVFAACARFHGTEYGRPLQRQTDSGIDEAGPHDLAGRGGPGAGRHQ